MTIIPVVHCFDNNYVIPAAVAFLSMLEHASSEYFYKLYVLHTDISIENQQKLKSTISRFKNASLEFINMENKFEDLFSELKTKGHYSKEVLYKLLVASIFTEYDHIIVTDVDVLYQGDISNGYIHFLSQEDKYVACIKTIMRPGTFLERSYNNYQENFNEEERIKLDSCGGYLIFNLKKIRNDNIERLFVEILKNNLNRLLQAEQDVINLAISHDKRFYLPLNSLVCSYTYDIYEDKQFHEDVHYSSTEIEDAINNPIQLHYATAIKPWNTLTCTKSELWFYYLTQTPFFKQYFDNLNGLLQENAKMTYTLAGFPILKIKKSKAKLFNFLSLKKRVK